MAKEQGLPLNPTKISGVCGRLMCCLRYENEVYRCFNRSTPNLGSEVNVDGETYRVVGLDAIGEKVIVQSETGSVSPWRPASSGRSPAGRSPKSRRRSWRKRRSWRPS